MLDALDVSRFQAKVEDFQIDPHVIGIGGPREGEPKDIWLTSRPWRWAIRANSGRASTWRLGYLRNQWEPLTNYVQEAHLPLDNNATERDLRALTVGRNNWLFVGSHQAGPRAAMLYSVVASAARHHLDIWAYLREVMQRLACGEQELSSLLPDAWAAAHPQAIRSYRGREREAVAAAKRARRQRRRALERAKAQRR